MKVERRKPTRAEFARITSSRPVVRKIPAPEKKPQRPGPSEAVPDRGNHQDRGEGLVR